ncbi:MAG: protein-L-isoaspartate(D-aspartate) O-methyltransferase [Planctomycetota bacterium]|nr:protein-L-isoaspartate(D-aspartate) O-methyltransferase [Planctomycetota bacterium]MDA1177583.1 protein-L-isoaspartate(D-aspartate) O-methyltransferase [Planctomycetota bacterium]
MAPLYGDDPFADARARMVAEAVVQGGIKHPGVIAAIGSVPRHLFVPPKDQAGAYLDMAMPIGHGQTISPPYIVAFMTAELDPQPTDRVLEIGTGSGYQAAVLSPLAQAVFSIEIVEPLGRSATQRLKKLGYQNVSVRIGDGYQGWPEHAPFDKIIVTCSPEDVPQPLVDQLVEGGLMVVPVGERFQQTLYRFRKRGTKLERESLQSTFFVPMTGQAEAERNVLPDLARPEIANGSFETLAEQSELPAGWYYLRQVKSLPDATAPEGGRVMQFSNSDPGRPASAIQSFGVDGTQVHELELTFSVRANDIQAGNTPNEAAVVGIEFYGANRAAVGNNMTGPFQGTFAWQRTQKRIPVPKAARLAVIGAGLFGATGTLAIDDVQLRNANPPAKRKE